MNSLHIRPATASDAATLAGLIDAAFSQYRGRLVPESGAFGEKPEVLAAELARPGHGALLGELDGAPAGCVLFKPEHGDLYFGRLSVPPAMRGRGIARALIEGVEARAISDGFPAVRLGVRIVLTENQRLFASLGYREISREAHPGFDHPTSITMRKPLSSPGDRPQRPA